MQSNMHWLVVSFAVLPTTSSSVVQDVVNVSVDCNVVFRKSVGNPDLRINSNKSAFDAFNIMSPFVFHNNITNKWQMLYAGGPQTTPAYLNYQLGMAEASTVDGPWTRYGKPLLPLGVEDNFHCTPTLLRGVNNEILIEDGRYHMIFCGNRQDDIYHATSSDGKHWEKDPVGTIFRGYSPSILRINGTLWLYSIAKPNVTGKVPSWRVSLARGSNWTTLKLVERDLIVSNTQPWEDGMMFYPNVIFEDTKTKYGWTISWSAYSNHTFLNLPAGVDYTAIGLAHSSNGLNWTKCASNPILRPDKNSSYDSVYVGCPNLIIPSNLPSTDNEPQSRLYFSSRIDHLHKYYAIAHAESVSVT
eukprot:m.122989 g.122989  ORF g.122989 m.122989 type:complete len:358 (-) comp14440_c0_seq1:14-1087(-)